MKYLSNMSSKTAKSVEVISHDKHTLYKCSVCDGTFSTTSNCKRHMRTMHNVEPIFDNRTPTLKCPLCDDYLKTYTLFDEHLMEKHKVVLIRKKLDFANFKSFQEWKLSEEGDTQSSYILSLSSSRNGQKTLKYKCHRSGRFIPRPQKSDKARKPKLKGTNKMNSICPSRLTVTQKANGKVTVEYVSTHVGHEQEPDRLRLNPVEREAIAEKLLQGIPKAEILKDISGKYSPTKRISYTTRRDLNNIQRSLKAKTDNDGASKKPKMSEDDPTCVTESVEEQEQEGEEESETTLPNEYILVLMNPEDGMHIREDGVDDFESCIVIDNVADSTIDKLEQRKSALKDQLHAIIDGLDDCNSVEELDFIKQNIRPILPGLQVLNHEKNPPKTINLTLYAQEESRPQKMKSFEVFEEGN